MYHTINEFIIEWNSESSSTLKVLKAMTDSSLSQKVSAEGRSLGFIAWHIVLTLGEMGSKAGLVIESPAENSPTPTSASEISIIYEKAAKGLDKEVQNKWNDKMLDEVIEMYGEKWTRAQTLVVLLKHEVHHRAQMTVLMRQAGLKVPGVYGPAKEEWATYGMPPMA
ncbi:MAG: DinB family protein [Ignavibacteriales bacterium]|nr:DinB family protein [Ignavibacteriales bacterium]